VGDVCLKVNFLAKLNHSLARERMPATWLSSEIPYVSYLHRIDYNAARLWSRSRDGLERRTNVSSRLEKNCQRLGLVSVSGSRLLGVVSVSAIYVSCPRPIFGQIVQATLIKRVNFGRHNSNDIHCTCLMRRFLGVAHMFWMTKDSVLWGH